MMRLSCATRSIVPPVLPAALIPPVAATMIEPLSDERLNERAVTIPSTVSAGVTTLPFASKVSVSFLSLMDMELVKPPAFSKVRSGLKKPPGMLPTFSVILNQMESAHRLNLF